MISFITISKGQGEINKKIKVYILTACDVILKHF